MTTLLEQRYRRALRLLPAAYRDAWADDMVATFLEGAYASMPDDPEGVDVSRPRWGEMASIAALAIRLRLGGIDSPARPRLWGDSVRLAARLGLLAMASLRLSFVLINVWVALRLPGTHLPPGVTGIPSRWMSITALLGLAAVPAFVFVLYGQYRSARVLAAAALAVVIAVFAVDIARGIPISTSGWVLLVIWVLTVLATLAYEANTPPPDRSWRWLVALAALVLACTIAGLLTARAPYVDEAAVWCVALVLVWAAGRRRFGPPWMLALAMTALALLVLRVALTRDWLQVILSGGTRAGVLAVGLVEAAAVALVGLACAVRVRRYWRELPDVATELAGSTPERP